MFCDAWIAVFNHPSCPPARPRPTDRIGEESYIDLFVQGEKAARFEKLVPSYDHEMRGDLLTIKLKSAEMNIVSGTMDRILDVGTMMPGGLYLSGSRIRAEFRFHPSDLHSVTILAGGILQMRNGMDIVSLGPDPGGIASIGTVNDRISLSVVGFDTDLPAEIGSTGITEAYFEVNSVHAMKDSLRSIAICPSSTVRQPCAQQRQCCTHTQGRHHHEDRRGKAQGFRLHAHVAAERIPGHPLQSVRGSPGPALRPQLRGRLRQGYMGMGVMNMHTVSEVG